MTAKIAEAVCLWLAILALLLGTNTYTEAADNIIRQKVLNYGLQYDIVTTDNSGNGIAKLPMQAGGSSFELFAHGSAWDTNVYFLDRKVIGHYLPVGTIQIQTGDSYHDWFNPQAPPRTRADKPYQLAISVSGLTADPTAPRAAREVLYTHVGQNYDSTFTPNGHDEYIVSSFYMFNQQPNFSPVYTSLTPMAPTKAMGIEKFTLSSLTDQTVKESSILDEDYLIVWPVSEAIIEGIQPGMTIRDSLPNIVVRYKDLYPLSYTYIQIYQGPATLGASGSFFGSSIRWHNTVVPQNEIVSIENWENMIPDDGQYTLEVVTLTPFDNWTAESLKTVTFNVNRKVKVNGQVVTSEK